MIVRRAQRFRRFTIIDNEVIEDNELSFRALGLLVYLLSKPDDWAIDAEQLADTHAEGRDAIRAALEWLELAGYAVRRRYRAGGKFATETVIYDRPHDREIGPISHRDGKPALVNRAGRSGPYTSTETKDCKQEESGGASGRHRTGTGGSFGREPDDASAPAPEPDAPGVKKRPSKTERDAAAEESNKSMTGKVLGMRTRLVQQGFSDPVNVTQLVTAMRRWGISLELAQQMIDVFVANPKRYLKGDEVPWTGFLRQREVLKADARKMLSAADPHAKFKSL